MKRFISGKKNLVYSAAMILIGLLAVYNLFFNLGNFQIANYDEARHGASAYEMLQTGNYIVNTYRYSPDYWNLKPPLSFWSVILGYRIAGYNALGLRLIAAVFGLLTILLVAAFMLRQHGRLASAISALVLTTTFQYLTNHGARTGNPDSLYVFFFTASVLALLLSGKNDRWIYVSGLAFSLAFLTKSWHAFSIVAIMGLFLLFSNRSRSFRFRQWLLLVSCMFLPIIIWALIRYQFDGLTFFKDMVAYDLLKRSENTIEGHVGGKLFYFRIFSSYYIYWLSLLFGVILIYLDRAFSFKQYRQLAAEKRAYLIGILAWVVLPVLIFSFAKTKIRWYILPIYPAFAVIIGMFAGKVIRHGRQAMKIVLIATLLLVSGLYELNIYRYVHHDYPDIQQTLIQQLKTKDGMKGRTLFYYKRKKAWPQKLVLTAELTDNLHVTDGSFSTFLNTDHGLLMIQKKFYTQKFMHRNHLRTIAFNKWGSIVDKVQ
jgi:4-amino-4-deoxy-L-arabinose transferase and related glycosyltransferases of PMT family